VQKTRLKSVRKISVSSTGTLAGLYALAIICGAASARIGEMQGMHHHAGWKIVTLQ
jgi:hypothetical protein